MLLGKPFFIDWHTLQESKAEAFQGFLKYFSSDMSLAVLLFLKQWKECKQ